MKLITLIIVLVSLQSFSQNTKIFDKKYNDSLLVGECNVDAFKIYPYNKWFNYEYSRYTPNDSVINIIKQNITNNTKITIVFGVWCSDSRREVPRFIKILYSINFDMNNLNIICVDTDKNAGKTRINGYNIELVPTFIFYKNKVEVGRIIETPEKTLEEDLLNILN